VTIGTSGAFHRASVEDEEEKPLCKVSTNRPLARAKPEFGSKLLFNLHKLLANIDDEVMFQGLERQPRGQWSRDLKVLASLVEGRVHAPVVASANNHFLPTLEG